jgi:hypothetical protein
MPRALSLLAALALLAACRRPEPPEVVRARTQKAFLETQIGELEGLVARAERGELQTANQIAIGIDEKVVTDLLAASLPPEFVVAGRLRLRLETARPLFRGNQAALAFRGRASSVNAPAVFVSLELAGLVDEFVLRDGKLSARVKVPHFALLDTSVTALAPLANEIIRNNLPLIEEQIPPLEIPVRLDEALRIEGAKMGPLTVHPGSLPFKIAVARVMPVNQRLWILLDATAGPWVPAGASPPPS